MTYGAANRLATYNGSAVQFDDDGNMVYGPLNGQMDIFGYDSRNRLVQAGSTVYRYDAENRRIGVDGADFVVNSQPALSQMLVKAEDGNKTFYVYGLGLIGEESAAGYRAYHFDLRGSTVALSDAAGAVAERFRYSAYGLLLVGDASLTPFLFNGMYGVMSDANGLYHMRARFYSAGIRRFLNRDILLGNVAEGQTLNRFAFVTGRPVRFVDPFGFAPLTLERAREIVRLFIPEIYNPNTQVQWADLPIDTGGHTHSNGDIEIDKTLDPLRNTRIRLHLEQCGTLSPDFAEIAKDSNTLELLETVIYEYMHSTIGNRIKQDNFFGPTYIFWDNVAYNLGIDGTWHGSIYENAQQFALILVRYMLVSDQVFYLFEQEYDF